MRGGGNEMHPKMTTEREHFPVSSDARKGMKWKEKRQPRK